jgi:hypothetical protein
VKCFLRALIRSEPGSLDWQRKCTIPPSWFKFAWTQFRFLFLLQGFLLQFISEKSVIVCLHLLQMGTLFIMLIYSTTFTGYRAEGEDAKFWNALAWG